MDKHDDGSLLSTQVPQASATDEDNALEHAIREHCCAQQRAWDKVHVQPPNKLFMHYTQTDRDGTWTIRSYLPELVTSGAELSIVMSEHVRTYMEQRSIMTLRNKRS